MENKFELTNETIEFKGRTLHRIRALKTFSNVRKGDLGGWLEKEENLSQEGNCWIYDNAKVYDDARVRSDAIICNHAEIYDNAFIDGTAMIQKHSKVYEFARVSDSTNVSDNVLIHERAKIRGFAFIRQNAEIFGSAIVLDRAMVEGNSKVSQDAMVNGRAILVENAVVSRSQIVSYGVVNTNLANNVQASIIAQCNLPVIDRKVIAYKLVRPDLTSFYDPSFQYGVGKVIEAEDYEISDRSCAGGLHFSNIAYWVKEMTSPFVCLEAEIDLYDIITVQEGKIRCKKAKILRAFNLI